MKLNQLVYVWRRRKFLEKVIRTAETLSKNNDVNKEEYSPTKYVVLHFHVKAIKLVRGLLVLCKGDSLHRIGNSSSICPRIELQGVPRGQFED